MAFGTTTNTYFAIFNVEWKFVPCAYYICMSENRIKIVLFGDVLFKELFPFHIRYRLFFYNKYKFYRMLLFVRIYLFFYVYISENLILSRDYPVHRIIMLRKVCRLYTLTINQINFKRYKENCL